MTPCCACACVRTSVDEPRRAKPTLGFRPWERRKPRHIPTCLPCSQTYLRSSYTRPSRPRHVKKPLWDAALAKRRRGFASLPQPAEPIRAESAEGEVGAWAGLSGEG